MSWLFLRWPGNTEVITDAVRSERGYFGVSRHGGGIAAAQVDRVFTLADNGRAVLFQIADKFAALHTVIGSRVITLASSSWSARASRISAITSFKLSRASSIVRS